MIVQAIEQQVPFITKDGSTIRAIMGRTNAPVAHQSLAEASLAVNESTQRHHHRLSEEIYFILEGSAEMELDGETRRVQPGDAILIPPGAWHTLTALSSLRLLCCCAPPYLQDDTYFE